MTRIWYSLGYVGWVLWQVLLLSLHLGRDALTPGLTVTPRIVKLPTRLTSDREIAVMASSITITPGTLVLGIAPAMNGTPAALFVQALYGQDEDEVMADLRQMETRLLRASRGSAS